MSFDAVSYTGSKAERYDTLLAQAKALTDGINHPIANLANIAALLWQGLEGINWCGFYLMDDGALMLGPFCGLPACIRIPLGRGVCGTAAAEDRIQRVYDVHQFPGHIACDSASNSEIVIPIHVGGKVIGVLDIDSPLIGRFDECDQAALEKLTALIEAGCDFSRCEYTLQ
ncbi:MAG: GAF domain-containing protein [Clostridia bacterium]|nr:GAF domain-containing protein [Clostridia bacterium]